MEELGKREFDLFRTLIYERLGISISDKKVSLLQSRFSKLIRQKGLGGYRDLYDYIVSDGSGKALQELEDAITTNVTSFFREAKQWEYLKGYIAEHLVPRGDRKLRIWSAGCSSGEEPYSIAMFLKDNLPDWTSKSWRRTSPTTF